MSSDRKGPVVYVDCSDVGFGVLPVIEEGDPMPDEEHYAEAARQEEMRQLGLPLPSDHEH